MKQLSLLGSLFPEWRLYSMMLLNFALRTFRFFADLFLDILGLLYLPQRGRIPPVTDPLLLQSATQLTDKIRKGVVSRNSFHDSLHLFTLRVLFLTR